LQNHQCFSDGRLKKISLQVLTSVFKDGKIRTVNVTASAMRLNSHHAFTPQGNGAVTPGSMSRVELFCFLWLPTGQTKEMRPARAAVEKTGALTDKPARRLCWGTTGTPENVDLAPRLSVSVPVEI